MIKRAKVTIELIVDVNVSDNNKSFGIEDIIENAAWWRFDPNSKYSFPTWIRKIYAEEIERNVKEQDACGFCGTIDGWDDNYGCARCGNLNELFRG